VTKSSKAIVFPGQGAQFRGMGRALFGEFRDLVRIADQVVGYSLEELCLEDKHKQLNNTRYTQPALYVVNVLLYQRMLATGAVAPDLLAGHSLGEYCALFAAGAFDFETGLQLVAHRGELMSRVTGGGMAAVTGVPLATVTSVLEREGHRDIDIANINAPTQTVLAGPSDALTAVGPALERAGAVVVPLPVSAAFHSRYMEPVVDEFAQVIRRFRLRDPVIPVISNLHARPYAPGEIVDNLVGQIRSPVRWMESILYLTSLGDLAIQEIGPKATLTKLLDQITASNSSPAAVTAH
jgi:trans-AT polyketide synthase/acyltransferase/oxidoreductase domain-containing protein